MKSNLIILAIIALFTTRVNAQWITLYEGGNNTSHNLFDEWQGDFDYNPSSQNMTIQTGIGSANNNFLMSCYASPFTGGSAAIIKKIPDLEKYASVRIKLRMNLTDSVGTINYYSVNFNDVIPIQHQSAWNFFGYGMLDEYVYLSNINGDSSIYLKTYLLRADSVVLSYNYVLIEADTTQMLSVDVNTATDFNVFSNGSQININTNSQETYEYTVIATNGNEITKGKATGNSFIRNEFDSGIYFVLVKDKTSTIRQKVYLN